MSAPEPQTKRPISRRHDDSKRRGNIVVLTAVMLVMLLSMVAFAVDVGYIATVRTELQRSADAGALAGAGMLVEGTGPAVAAAEEYAAANFVGGKQVPAADILIDTGVWDANTETFVPGGAETPSAIRVRVNRPSENLFFGPVVGTDAFSATAESIARYRPRDIMLVLDYSGSMNDDSELKSIGSIGQANVEANLLQIYNELGAPTFGLMQWNPTYISSTSSTTIKNTLGLNNVPYPYPSGSWSDYFSYVQNDGDINNAGYRKDYGYLTWINYLLEKKPKANETPDLWMTSEQPISAVKDAVTVFLAYLQEVDTNDQLGLSVYTAADGNAVLESGLTANFQLVEDISQQRQAAHYDVYTNIGAGMKEARLEIQNNARIGALKMMVLMTDGVANKPSSTSTAKAYALSEADLAADAGIPIITISLGAGADTNLMQQIADKTGGKHFNVPGGQSVYEYEEGLKDVFKSIADDRPLQLVR